MSNARYWIGLNLIPGIGRASFGRLLEYFGDLEKAWHADSTELRAAGLDHRSVQSIVARRPKIELEAAMERLDHYNIKALTQNDTSSPPQDLKKSMIPRRRLMFAEC